MKTRTCSFVRDDWRLAFVLYFGFIIFSTSTSYANGIVSTCNACQNGAQCVTEHGIIQCRCREGFLGERCQYKDPCAADQCQNGGTCATRVNSEGKIGWSCVCPIGFKASLCEIRIPSACDNTPCQNSGTCVLETLETYKCICAIGFKGGNCREVDNCSSGPCHNGARCVSTDTGYYCRCAPGFSGPTCTQDIDECTVDNPCIRGRCVNRYGSYRCNCPEGYTGKNCESVFRPCDPSPCQHGANCYPYGKYKYSCECSAGYTGRHCEVDIDDCVEHECRNGGQCVDGVANYSCVCPENFQGGRCEKDMDECKAKPNMCHNGGTCVNHEGGFHCICVNGWEGAHCEINQDDCRDKVCYNGGTCHDRVASFYCECPLGKTGLLCHLDDACMSNPCLSGAICDTNPVDGGYICSCAKGYIGVDCSQDINECASGNPCEHGGTCVNTPGSYRCECAPGWKGDWCEENINECAPNPCKNDATCLDDVGQFICVCMPGFTGKHCEVNIDECVVNGKSPCVNGGLCQDLVYGYRCQCPRGFGGKNCHLEANDCTDESCFNGGTCVDEINGFSCRCRDGFSGGRCEVSSNDCSSSPCRNGATCLNGSGRFICVCKPGFTGRYCEQDLDDCTVNGRPQCHNGGICLDLINEFRCQCPAGYTGRFCERNVDDCSRDSCLNGGICVDEVNKYICHCPKGYSGHRCEHADLYCHSNPCLNGASCQDGIASFVCRCEPGFRGTFCEENVDECLLPGGGSPCKNGGICMDLPNSFSCRCPQGFTGRHCERNKMDCQTNSCLNGGTCEDMVNGFKCHCSKGFGGQRCEYDATDCRTSPCVNACVYNETDRRQWALCEESGCVAKADDGVCHPECNFFACGFDGGDCSAGLRPFENCSAPSYCSHVYKNGKCDAFCNTEECLFDGFDCVKDQKQVDEFGTSEHCQPFYQGYCSRNYGNGHCDEGCNTKSCGWDGGDCTQEQDKSLLKGDVILIVLVHPQTFINSSGKFLSSISQLIHATVRIKRNPQTDEPMIYSWNSQRGKGSPVPVPHDSLIYEFTEKSHRQKRDVNDVAFSGTILWLTIDVSKCHHQGRTDCFSNVMSVAAYFGAASAKLELKKLGYPLYSAYSEPDVPTTAGGSGINWSGIVIAVACIIAVLFLAVLVIVGRKRKIRAPVWFPGSDRDNRMSKCPSTSTLGLDYNSSTCDSNCGGSIYAQPNRPVGLMGNNYETHADFFRNGDKPSLHTRREPVGQESVTDLTKGLGNFLDEVEYGQNGDHPAPKRARKAEVEWTQAHMNAAEGKTDGGCGAMGLNSKGPNGVTPAMVAATAGVPDEDEQMRYMENLAMQGADFNAKTDLLQETALIGAVRFGRIGPVKIMLQHGVDPNEPDGQGRTPLHHAVALDCAELVSMLLNQCKDTIVDARDALEMTPLILAAKEGHKTAEVTAKLIHRGANVSAVDNIGRTALHYAAMSNRVETMKMLIDKSANKDAQDGKDQTPLFLAAKENAMEAVEFLLNNGASKDIQDQMEQTPEMIAKEKGNFKIVQILNQAATPPHISAAQVSGFMSANGKKPHPHAQNRRKKKFGERSLNIPILSSSPNFPVPVHIARSQQQLIQEYFLLPKGPPRIRKIKQESNHYDNGTLQHKKTAPKPPRRTKSLREIKGSPKMCAEQQSTGMQMTDYSGLSAGHMGGPSPHIPGVVSPQSSNGVPSCSVESPHSFTTPSPGNTLQHGQILSVPSCGSSAGWQNNADGQFGGLQNFSCMMSPYSGSHAGSSISGLSPPSATTAGAAYKSPPPPYAGGGNANYYHRSPLNYGQSPPEQYSLDQHNKEPYPTSTGTNYAGSGNTGGGYCDYEGQTEATGYGTQTGVPPHTQPYPDHLPHYPQPQHWANPQYNQAFYPASHLQQ